MKRIILMLSGLGILGLVSCEQTYPTRVIHRDHYYGSSGGGSYRLGPAPQGGTGIGAVGQPDSYSE